jgi:uncharacterized protein DUF5367
VILRALGVGFGIAAAILALFALAGPYFFIEGRRTFQINFAVAALLGMFLGYFVHRLAAARVMESAQAMALVAVPGMLVMAAVGSHFAVFFPSLDPALDKVFGSIILWFYGFALAVSVWRTRRG